jgi:hypothetical protein
MVLVIECPCRGRAWPAVWFHGACRGQEARKKREDEEERERADQDRYRQHLGASHMSVSSGPFFF